LETAIFHAIEEFWQIIALILRLFEKNFIEKDKTTIEIQARRLAFIVYHVLCDVFMSYVMLE